MLISHEENYVESVDWLVQPIVINSRRKIVEYADVNWQNWAEIEQCALN